MADSDTNFTSKIAFTLPLCCQICLGKVKLPVVCPNQHVFCSPCMDVWLKHHEQCPSCRVPITPENPCKKILGGLTQSEEEENGFAKNKELRRSRLELLCKDYEDEIERLQMESDTVQQEKRLLEAQVKTYSDQKLKTTEGDVAQGKDLGPSAPRSVPDLDMLMVLTKKLQAATELYERVKKDMDRLKKENSDLKDENAALTRENQRVHMELMGRSPRKYARVTVATLETKLEKYEKDMQQLQRALQQNDKYTASIEKELQFYRNKEPATCVQCSKNKIEMNKDKEQNMKGVVEETGAGESKSAASSSSLPWTRPLLNRWSSEPSSAVHQSADNDCRKFSPSLPSIDKKTTTNMNNSNDKKPVSLVGFYGKQPSVKEYKPHSTTVQHSNKTAQIDKVPDALNDTSFGLEMPSLSSSSAVSSSDANDQLDLWQSNDGINSTLDPKANDSIDDLESNDTLGLASSTGSCKKRLKFESDASDKARKANRGKIGSKSSAVAKQVTFQKRASSDPVSKQGNALTDSLLDISLPGSSTEMSLIKDIKPTLNETCDESFDVNMSINTDIMDCMELFSGAEKRLGQRERLLEAEKKVGPHTTQCHVGQNQHPQSAFNFVPTVGPMHSLQKTKQDQGFPQNSVDIHPRSSSNGNNSPGILNSLPSSSSTAKATTPQTFPDTVSSSCIDPYSVKSYMQTNTRPYPSGHGMMTMKPSENPTAYMSAVSAGTSSAGMFGVNHHSSQPQPGSHFQASASASMPGFNSGAGHPNHLVNGSGMSYMPRQNYSMPGSASTAFSANEPQPSSSTLSTGPTWSGATSAYNPASGYNAAAVGTGGISSSTDFRPSSSIPTASSGPVPGPNRSSCFALPQQGGMPGLPGGTNSLGPRPGPGPQANFVRMQNAEMSGIGGYGPMSSSSGLSQPMVRYGNEFGAMGQRGPGSSMAGFMPGYNGSMTQ